MTTKGSNNPFPSVLFAETVDPATPGAGTQRLFVDTDGILKLIDDAAVVTEISSTVSAAAHIADATDAHDASAISIVDTGTYFTGTDVETALQELGLAGGTTLATDPLWDAAGDVVVGSGANTAARLPIGNPGSALSRVNGAVAWNSGTSFPTAATGDRYWRTDLGLEFYYDGTRWLCTCPHGIDVGTQHALLVVSATNSHRAAAPEALTATIWLTTLTVGIYVTTTNDATKYWTVGLNGAASPATTQSLAPDTVHYLTQTLGSVFTIATTKWIQVDYTKVSTAGTAYPVARLGFRYIGT